MTGAKGGTDRFLTMLGTSIDKDERWLLDFFERTRNCLVHYDGRYARHIKFDDLFYGQRLLSEGNFGKPLPLFPPIALALHTEVHRAVSECMSRAGLDKLPGFDLALT